MTSKIEEELTSAVGVLAKAMLGDKAIGPVAANATAPALASVGPMLLGVRGARCYPPIRLVTFQTL